MKVEMICGTCGGAKVMRDAWAMWDAAAQGWALGAVFDYAQCDDCEGETSLQERPAADERAGNALAAAMASTGPTWTRT